MHSYCIKFYFEHAYFLLRHFHKYTDALPFFDGIITKHGELIQWVKDYPHGTYVKEAVIFEP